MKAGKSQHLQDEWASWRPQRTDSIVLSPEFGRHEAQKELIFQFKSKGRRKNPYPGLKAVKREG